MHFFIEKVQTIGHYNFTDSAIQPGSGNSGPRAHLSELWLHHPYLPQGIHILYDKPNKLTFQGGADSRGADTVALVEN